MKTCIIAGVAHYRLPVYNQMAKVLDCDYYVSPDDPSFGIVSYDYKKLINLKGILAQERKIIGNFTWIKGMTQLFFKPYDLYIIGGPYNINGWLMILMSFFSRKKIGSWSHGLYGKESGLRKYIKILFYKLCDKNFVYNERAASLMYKCGIKDVTVVGNSLDTEKELDIRKTLKKTNVMHEFFHNCNPVLIFVGRVTKIKRLDLVLKSMKILREKGINVNFLVVGKDVEGVNLTMQAKQLGLQECLYMYGPCYDDYVLGNLYYNSDVCVSPGNVGLTAMGSLTYGCPVITNDDYNNQMPEFEAIVSGLTGDFFKNNDADDLALKIENWIGKSDEERQIIRETAFGEIDRKWNIYSETEAFKRALL